MTLRTGKAVAVGGLGLGLWAGHGWRQAAMAVLLGFAVFAVARAAPAPAQEDLPLRFFRLPLSGALVQNTVSDMLQDRRGLIWFATLGGVNVYDGYQFRLVPAEPGDPNSLSGVHAARLFEDRSGHVWVAGQLGWLDRLDPRDGSVRHFPRRLFGPEGQPGAGISDFFETTQGILWIGTVHGLHRYDPARDRLDEQVAVGDGHAPLLGISYIEPAGAGRLWLGTTTGLYRYDPAKGALERFAHDPADPRSLSNDVVSALYSDTDGSLWVGTLGGLNRWLGEGRGFQRYLHAADDPRSIGGDIITSLLRDRQGRLWIGAQSGGLSLMTGQDFEVFHHDADDAGSLAIDDIWSLFEDRSGLIWVGTAGGGVVQINPYKYRFQTLRAIPYNPNSLRSSFVWDLAEDRQGRVWMTTLAGLECFDPGSGKFSLYAPRPGAVAANQLQSLHIDDQQQLWIGSVDGHLFRFDPVSARFTTVADPERSDGRLTVGRIWYVTAGPRPDQLWVSTNNDLLTLDSRSGRVVDSLAERSGLNLTNGPVRVILRDEQGVFWLGSGVGLLRQAPDGSVTRIHQRPGDTRSLSDNAVRSLHLGEDGSLWAGTYNGLNKLSAADRKAGRWQFEVYSRADGLPNNTIYGIVPESDGQLWLTSNAGLSRFDTRTGQVRHYDRRDGLPADELNGGAELRASDGSLYFGGVAGVVRVRPQSIPRNQYVPPVQITAVTVGGRAQDGAFVLAAPRQLALDYAEGGVSISFSAMDFHAPEKNRFRYRLGDGEWIERDDNRVDFLRPEPGRYRFEVLGSNSDGVWSTEPATLDLVVHPPWWRTWQAYATYVLLAAAAFAGYHRQQRRRLLAEQAFSTELSKAHSLADANFQLAQRNAQFDELTQLPNRRSLLDALGRYMRLTRSKRQPLALLVVNLDRFQRVNDTLGHAVGDRVLKTTAERLQAAIRGDDMLARTGSDEFALVSVGQVDDDGAWLDVLAARLLAAVAEPQPLQDPPLRLTASIGICLHEDENETPNDLFTRADIAMHLGKSGGGNAVRRYQAGMRERQRERLGLEARMRRALEAGEFAAVYQPLIELRNGRLYGFESLIRWLPPGQAPIYPDQFIPVAEESGLIVDLGAWMIEEVVRQLGVWQRPDLKVAVNVAMRQLRGGALVTAVDEALRRRQVPAACLKVEITETAMMENVDATVEQLQQLRALGVGISIDDFGTGFSSLSHLQRLPATELKIDRCFVQDLAGGEHNRKIVRSIIRMAHELRLGVVAEGIEDADALAYLRDLGCDWGQGYLFDKPLPAVQVQRWLDGHRFAIPDSTVVVLRG